MALSLLLRRALAALTIAAAVPAAAAAQPRVYPDTGERLDRDLCTDPVAAGGAPRTGRVEIRRDDGTLDRSLACVDGRRDGVERAYHANGTQALERHWRAGALSGPLRRWFPNGTLREAWRHGPLGVEGSYRVFHENGMPAAVAEWHGGKRDGPYVDYDKAGRPVETGRYVRGVADGLEVVYFPSGAAKRVRRFDMGRQVGIQTLWSENGRRLRSEHYTEDGRFVRRFVWNVDGTLRSTTEAVDIPGHGRGLREVRYVGCLTYTTIESGVEDPARYPWRSYADTPNLYKLETVHAGEALVDRVEAFDHKLLAEPIHKERPCCCPQDG